MSLSESSSERLLPVRPCRCGGRGRQNVLHAPVTEDALLGLGCRVTGFGIQDLGLNKSDKVSGFLNFSRVPFTILVGSRESREGVRVQQKQR